MEMTYSEICASYRQAKHRNNQIGVLADLNCCDREEIREILEEFGEIQPKTKQAHNVKLAEREKELRLALGLSVRQVSKIAGIGKTTLSNFENRLPTSENTVNAIARAVKKLERMKEKQTRLTGHQNGGILSHVVGAEKAVEYITALSKGSHG